MSQRWTYRSPGYASVGEPIASTEGMARGRNGASAASSTAPVGFRRCSWAGAATVRTGRYRDGRPRSPLHPSRPAPAATWPTAGTARPPSSRTSDVSMSTWSAWTLREPTIHSICLIRPRQRTDPAADPPSPAGAPASIIVTSRRPRRGCCGARRRRSPDRQGPGARWRRPAAVTIIALAMALGIPVWVVLWLGPVAFGCRATWRGVNVMNGWDMCHDCGSDRTRPHRHNSYRQPGILLRMPNWLPSAPIRTRLRRRSTTPCACGPSTSPGWCARDRVTARQACAIAALTGSAVLQALRSAE